MLSLTVIVCSWSAAALPHLSVRCHVLAMLNVPSHGPAVTTSVYVALIPVEQLSASSVTSPVIVGSALYVHVAVVKISVSAGLVNVGAMLSDTVIVCSWSAAALPHLSVRCHVLAMLNVPSHGPAVTTSVYVALIPVEQLSASSVTSPVIVGSALYVQVAVVKISVSTGRVNVGAMLSLTVIV